MGRGRIPRSQGDVTGCVLIIDDNLDLGDLYTATLRWAHIGVEVAHTADDGWAAATAREPDLILLDIDLGEHNGLDLLDRFHAHSWSNRPPKIAMFTNASHPQFQARAESAGADAYWTKAGLRLPDFVAAVQALLRQQGVGGAGASDEEQTQQEG